MSTNAWWAVVAVLFLIIIGLGWLILATPAPSAGTAATTTSNGTGTGGAAATSTATTTLPLSARVVVTSPEPNEEVGKTFVVAGTAPGPWFFEAVFPIQVRDANNRVIASTHGTAQGNWMTTGQVTFTATITVANYTGPATLVLMRDNPSGLPENDDSVSIPITIK